MLIHEPSLKIFYSTKINDNQFFSGFGTKEAGNAASISNIINYFIDINESNDKLVVLDQVHSVNIGVVDQEKVKRIEKVEETDGVVSKEAGVILTVRTADCLPIIYCDKKNQVIGISHNGWRGSIKRMVQRMVDKMISLGAESREILVAIGPGIGGCCYDINDDRYYQFREEFEDYSDRILQNKRGKRLVNLTLLNYLLLLEKGIDKKNIDFFPFCTKCDRARFFSFRRDTKKEYGEMLSFIIRRN